MRPIDFELRCATCGYDLQGRSALGRCSECGTTVGRTINEVSRRELSLGRLRDTFSLRTPRSLITALFGLLAFVELILVLRAATSFENAVAIASLLVTTAGSTFTIGRHTAFVTDAPKWWRPAIIAEVGCVISFFSLMAVLVGPRLDVARAMILTLAMPVWVVREVTGVEIGERTPQMIGVVLAQFPAAILIGTGLLDLGG